MLDAGAGDAQRRACHGGKADQRADLDVVGLDSVGGLSQRRRPMHDHGVGADALDLRAERHEEIGEVLHMGLGGRVAQIGDALGGDRRDQGILRRGDARLVQEHVRAGELGRSKFEPVGRGDLCPQLLQRQHMRVQTAAADDVAARRRQHHFAAAGEQGPGEQDGGADAHAELGVEIGGADALGMDVKRIAGRPFR